MLGNFVICCVDMFWFVRLLLCKAWAVGSISGCTIVEIYYFIIILSHWYRCDRERKMCCFNMYHPAVQTNKYVLDGYGVIFANTGTTKGAEYQQGNQRIMGMFHLPLAVRLVGMSLSRYH